MRLQMGGVDHQLIRLATLRREAGKYLVENPHPAPTDKAIVDRLGWPILPWSIAPAQPFALHDGTHHLLR